MIGDCLNPGNYRTFGEDFLTRYRLTDVRNEAQEVGVRRGFDVRHLRGRFERG